jgi:hypothetical protein
MGVAGMFLMVLFASVLYTLLREYAHNRLNQRDIDPEKLEAQPPELQSHFKMKREKRKEKRKVRRDERKNKRVVRVEVKDDDDN